MANTTYDKAVLADSPTAYWKCGEASGNLADSSGNGHTFTKVGTITYGNASLLPADFGTCISMVGFNNCFTNSSLSAWDGDVSVEAWVTTTVTGTTQTLFYGGGVWGFGCFGSPNNFWSWFDVTHGQTQTATVPSTGTTYYVVATYTYSTRAMSLYINGSFVQTVTPALQFPASGTGALLARDPANSVNWWGKVQKLAYYRSVLSSGRIAAHFAAASQPTPGQAGGASSAALARVLARKLERQSVQQPQRGDDAFRRRG